MTTFVKDKAVIVVGEDYSQNSADALKAASTFAATLADLALHIVHVTKAGSSFANGPNRSSAASPNHQAPDDLQTDRAALKVVTLSTAASVAEHGAHVFGHLRFGNPAREIVQLASDLSADLIVVGTHGRTGMRKLLLGSVAQNILTNASCPVLVVKPKDLPPWPEIEPPCPDCVTARHSSHGLEFWCARHSEHHASAHTYYVNSDSYGLGAQTFRGLS
ncbi:MAG TPA: universal stress protein [Polyangiaceae bacterium]|nr:universal stress protein [Polyangiaceae bacterium]